MWPCQHCITARVQHVSHCHHGCLPHVSPCCSIYDRLQLYTIYIKPSTRIWSPLCVCVSLSIHTSQSPPHLPAPPTLFPSVAQHPAHARRTQPSERGAETEAEGGREGGGEKHRCGAGAAPARRALLDARAAVRGTCWPRSANGAIGFRSAEPLAAGL